MGQGFEAVRPQMQAGQGFAPLPHLRRQMVFWADAAQTLAPCGFAPIKKFCTQAKNILPVSKTV